MASSPIHRFPQELVDAIVDASSGSVGTLRACALASHSFRIPAQKRLFSRIYLDTQPPTGHRIARLKAVLTVNPSLREHIKVLKIFLRYSTTSEQSINSLHDLLPMFSSLCNLTIVVFRWQTLHNTVWESNILRSAIANMLQLPSLSSVHLEGPHPPELMPSCLYVKHMELNWARMSAWPPHHTIPTRTVDLPVQSLTLRTDRPDDILPLISQPTPYVRLSHVRTLKLSLFHAEREVPSWQRMLDYFASSVEDLELEFYIDEFRDESLPPLDMSSFERLQALKLGFGDFFGLLPHLAWIEGQFANCLPKNHPLHILRIHLHPVGTRHLDDLMEKLGAIFRNASSLSTAKVELRLNPAYLDLDYVADSYQNSKGLKILTEELRDKPGAWVYISDHLVYQKV